MTPSEEVLDAIGEAPERTKAKTIDVIELLKRKRASLEEARQRYSTAKAMRDEKGMSNESRVIDALREIIPELERDVSVVREARGKKEAEGRLLGIKRAYGSATSTYKDDEAKVEQAVIALREAITTLNNRARKLDALRAEAAALGDRFGLTVPKLTTLNEPQQGITLPPFWRILAIRPSFEDCEHGLRQRRDYTEIGGTPGYGIITTAGLKPFRALTEREREVLEDRAEERKPDPVLAQAAIEANALGDLGVPGGGVARG